MNFKLINNRTVSPLILSHTNAFDRPVHDARQPVAGRHRLHPNLTSFYSALTATYTCRVHDTAPLCTYQIVLDGAQGVWQCNIDTGTQRQLQFIDDQVKVKLDSGFCNATFPTEIKYVVEAHFRSVDHAPTHSLSGVSRSPFVGDHRVGQWNLGAGSKIASNSSHLPYNSEFNEQLRTIEYKFENITQILEKTNAYIVFPDDEKTIPTSYGFRHNLGRGPDSIAKKSWGNSPYYTVLQNRLASHIHTLRTKFPERVLFGRIGTNTGALPIGHHHNGNTYYHVWGANPGNENAVIPSGSGQASQFGASAIGFHIGINTMPPASLQTSHADPRHAVPWMRPHSGVVPQPGIQQRPQTALAFDISNKFNEALLKLQTTPEDSHDFVQVLFPTHVKSQFANKNLTLTSAADYQTLEHEKILIALTSMTDHLGLAMDISTGTITAPTDPKSTAQRSTFLHDGNHNQKRVSRVLHCLKSIITYGQLDPSTRQRYQTALDTLYETLKREPKNSYDDRLAQHIWKQRYSGTPPLTGAAPEDSSIGGGAVLSQPISFTAFGKQYTVQKTNSGVFQTNLLTGFRSELRLNQSNNSLEFFDGVSKSWRSGKFGDKESAIRQLFSTPVTPASIQSSVTNLAIENRNVKHLNTNIVQHTPQGRLAVVQFNGDYYQWNVDTQTARKIISPGNNPKVADDKGGFSYDLADKLKQLIYRDLTGGAAATSSPPLTQDTTPAIFPNDGADGPDNIIYNLPSAHVRHLSTDVRYKGKEVVQYQGHYYQWNVDTGFARKIINPDTAAPNPHYS